MTDTATSSAPRQVPDHARTVVVPLANPDTAQELLSLARAVVRSHGGKVIAVAVVLGDADAEANLDRIEALSEMVDTAKARDGQVELELVTRPAVSIARGILDATRDEGADMVVLGVQAPTPGGVAIGGIAEQVVAAAECDVLIYRRGRNEGGLQGATGVVVGVDGSDDARVAARLGIIIGQGLGLPVEMLHIRLPGESEDEAARLLDAALVNLEGEGHCHRRVMQSKTATQGLRSHVDSARLTVVGFHSIDELNNGRLGQTTRGALDTLRGPVVAISRRRGAGGSGDAILRSLLRIRPKLTAAETRSLVWAARLSATLSVDFVVLSVVAAMLATFGLILNSAAVIIGAMLVAPLMSPLVAFGTALVDGETRTLRRASITVAVGSAIVAGTAFLLGILVGPDVPNSEMLSRGSPSLVDAGVAAASGIIGGYATARKGIPAALAGVAIAAALVPPICVFGLALTLDGRLATGAGLLFLTNIACIAASSAIVLLWLGVRPIRTDAKRANYVRFTAPVLAGVLGAVVLFGLTGAGPDFGRVRAIVEEEMTDVEIVSIDGTGPPDTVTVTVRRAGSTVQDDIAAAAQRVEEELDGLQLRLAVQTLVVPAGD